MCAAEELAAQIAPPGTFLAHELGVGTYRTAGKVPAPACHGAPRCHRTRWAEPSLRAQGYTLVGLGASPKSVSLPTFNWAKR